MNSLEIKDKKEQLKLRCHEIINSAKTEIRELTDEEKTEFEANKAEIISLNEQLKELEAKLAKYEDEIPTDEVEEEVEEKATEEEFKEEEEVKEELPKTDEESEENKEENRSNITMKKTKFNLINAINDVVNNRSLNDTAAAVVAEGKEEMRKSGLNYSGQITIPTEMRSEVTVTSEHDDVVGIEVMPIMEALRAKSVLHEAGAKFLSNLQNDVVLPVMTAGNVAWQGEIVSATEAGETFKSVKLQPKRLTAYVDVSKQFLAQASKDAEEMLKNDLIAAISQKLEATVLGEENGSATQPTGIFYNSGETTSITDFKGVCELESNVEDANVMGECTYILSNKAKAALRNMPKSTKSTELVYQAGEIDGTKAYNTSNVANKNIAFGDFSNLVIGQWGGLDLIVDPYSRAKDAVVRIVVNAYFDAAVVREGSIAIAKIA